MTDQSAYLYTLGSDGKLYKLPDDEEKARVIASQRVPGFSGKFARAYDTMEPDKIKSALAAQKTSKSEAEKPAQNASLLARHWPTISKFLRFAVGATPYGAVLEEAANPQTIAGAQESLTGAAAGSAYRAATGKNLYPKAPPIRGVGDVVHRIIGNVAADIPALAVVPEGALPDIGLNLAKAGKALKLLEIPAKSAATAAAQEAGNEYARTGSVSLPKVLEAGSAGGAMGAPFSAVGGARMWRAANLAKRAVGAGRHSEDVALANNMGLKLTPAQSAGTLHAAAKEALARTFAPEVAKDFARHNEKIINTELNRNAGIVNADGTIPSDANRTRLLDHLESVGAKLSEIRKSLTVPPLIQSEPTTTQAQDILAILRSGVPVKSKSGKLILSNRQLAEPVKRDLAESYAALGAPLPDVGLSASLKTRLENALDNGLSGEQFDQLIKDLRVARDKFATGGREDTKRESFYRYSGLMSLLEDSAKGTPEQIAQMDTLRRQYASTSQLLSLFGEDGGVVHDNYNAALIPKVNRNFPTERVREENIPPNVRIGEMADRLSILPSEAGARFHPRSNFAHSVFQAMRTVGEVVPNAAPMAIGAGLGHFMGSAPIGAVIGAAGIPITHYLYYGTDIPKLSGIVRGVRAIPGSATIPGRIVESTQEQQ